MRSNASVEDARSTRPSRKRYVPNSLLSSSATARAGQALNRALRAPARQITSANPLPRLACPYQELPASADVGQRMRALRERVEALITLHEQRKHIDAQIDELIRVIRVIGGIQNALTARPEKPIARPLPTVPATPPPPPKRVEPRTPAKPAAKPIAKSPAKPPRDPRLANLPAEAAFNAADNLMCTICDVAFATNRHDTDGRLRQTFGRHVKSRGHEEALATRAKAVILSDDESSSAASEESSEAEEEKKDRLTRLVNTFAFINTKSRGPAAEKSTRKMYGTAVRDILMCLPREMQTPKFYKNVAEIRQIVLDRALSPSQQKVRGAAMNSFIQGLKLPGEEGVMYEQLYNALMREATPKADVAQLLRKHVKQWVPYTQLVEVQQQRLAMFEEALEREPALKAAVESPDNDFNHDPIKPTDPETRAKVVDAFLTSMYILLPPVRVEEIILLYINPQDVQVEGEAPLDDVVREGATEDDAEDAEDAEEIKADEYRNWIDWTNHTFVRVKSKMSHLYGMTRFLLPLDLFRIMKAQAHLVGNSNQLLLPTRTGKRYTSQYGKRVAAAFGVRGLTVGTLRVIFSTTFSEIFMRNANLRQWVARIMGHSTAIHETQYAKRYDLEGRPLTKEFIFGEGVDPAKVPTPWLTTFAGTRTRL
ncbi:hypothetical protein PAPYR_12806 [Paratrimastix pyriformis]|uniref:Uncharacterized protein n=1 Tax=Paratrimastix pyriformis TaxID=342808 RepID=A0ABQ8U4W4_9EUKA|nr:hypothetical protein PAPYR_12806 [Paratrimastix pyriformis]